MSSDFKGSVLIKGGEKCGEAKVTDGCLHILNDAGRQDIACPGETKIADAPILGAKVRGGRLRVRVCN